MCIDFHGHLNAGLNLQHAAVAAAAELLQLAKLAVTVAALLLHELKFPGNGCCTANKGGEEAVASGSSSMRDSS
jgi:hypothetical protein